MDTPVVNGCAYPYLDRAPQAYRFRILNAVTTAISTCRCFWTPRAAAAALGYCNGRLTVGSPTLARLSASRSRTAAPVIIPPWDHFYRRRRFWRLGHGNYIRTGGIVNGITINNGGRGIFSLPPLPSVALRKLRWCQGRSSRATRTPGRRTAGTAACRIRARAGPSWYAIGSEGGWLPGVAVIPPQPVSYQQSRQVATVLNVTCHSLFLGPAERADVVIDFSGGPVGTNVIMYNDAPAPVPGF